MQFCKNVWGGPKTFFHHCRFFFLSCLCLHRLFSFFKSLSYQQEYKFGLLPLYVGLLKLHISFSSTRVLLMHRKTLITLSIYIWACGYFTTPYLKICENDSSSTQISFTEKATCPDEMWSSVLDDPGYIALVRQKYSCQQ